MVFDINPIFCKVMHIIVFEGKVSLFVNIIQTIGFNVHLRIYEIEYLNKYGLFDFRLLENCIPRIVFVASDSKKYISR